jgi:hypothetical protein
MNNNGYRVRAERGEVQIGTWINMIRTPGVLTLLQAAGLDFARATIINYSSDAAVLRSGYASVVGEIRRTLAARS